MVNNLINIYKDSNESYTHGTNVIDLETEVKFALVCMASCSAICIALEVPGTEISETDDPFEGTPCT